MRRKDTFNTSGLILSKKLDKHQLPLYDDFYSKLKNCNPLDKEDDGFEKLLITGYSEEQILKKLGYHNKDDVPTSGAMQKKILSWQKEYTC